MRYAHRRSCNDSVSHRSVTKEWEKDEPSCEDDNITVQRGTVFKEQSGWCEFLDGTVTFQLDFPVDD